MKPLQRSNQKILTLAELISRCQLWKAEGRQIVFTNGCFDILHAGHIASFEAAAAEGDVLIVGLNADASLRNLKGPGRPVNNEAARAAVVAALEVVDAVVLFAEPTPLRLIKAVQPQVLVKGGDYKVEEIAGAKEVIAWGGKVVINPIVQGFSTTAIIEKLQNPGQ